MEPCISIIIPTYFRNPHDAKIKAGLDQFFKQFLDQREDHFEIFISDSGPEKNKEIVGSVIESCLETHSWLRDKVRYHYEVTAGSPLSRSEAMNLGVRLTNGMYILFLHIDCHLSAGCLPQLRKAFANGAMGGGFLKKYVGKETFSPLLLTEQYLNWLRTWKGRHLVGTNGIYLHRELALEHPYEGIFLEDVELSDWMRVRLVGKEWQLIRTPIEVSARKYLKLGVWRSLAVNLSVMTFHRIFHLPPEKLKNQLYHRSFSQNWRFWKEWAETVFSLFLHRNV